MDSVQSVFENMEAGFFQPADEGGILMLFLARLVAGSRATGNQNGCRHDKRGMSDWLLGLRPARVLPAMQLAIGQRA